MLAFKYFGGMQPLLEGVKSTQSCTHSDDLKPVRLLKDLFDSFQLCDDGLYQVASVRVLDQMELINDKDLDIEEKLFLNQLVQQTVCLFYGANGDVTVRCPDTFAL